jgi:hypothetical protein
MGFKDPSAKKAYNEAYYQANKLRINAERIARDVKEKTIPNAVFESQHF